MAESFSFDVVSDFERQELVNTLDQVKREISQRYDLKATDTTVDLEKENIIFSLHSDMPMAPASPLVLMHSAVNRINFANKVAGPNQRVSVLEALKGVTINAAYTLGIESNYGSISPGKVANLTVLSANPLSIDPSSIDAIKVIATIEEGKINQF